MPLMAWRYRNAVLSQMEQIFAHVTPRQLRKFLDICFKEKWKIAVDELRANDVDAGHAAAFLTNFTVPYLMVPLSDDQKELTHFAFAKGNEAEPIAANFFGMVRASREIGGSQAADELYFRLLGALQGLEDDDLDRFILEKMG